MAQAIQGVVTSLKVNWEDYASEARIEARKAQGANATVERIPSPDLHLQASRNDRRRLERDIVLIFFYSNKKDAVV